jgi:hypothetical protein
MVTCLRNETQQMTTTREFRVPLLGVALIMIGCISLACGGAGPGTRHDSAGSNDSGSEMSTLAASEDKLPDQLADFPRPEASVVHCPCDPTADSRKTLAVLITTTMTPEEVITFFDGALSEAGYEITKQETDVLSPESNETQALFEFIKNGHPGEINIFPTTCSCETSVNISYFTAEAP